VKRRRTVPVPAWVFYGVGALAAIDLALKVARWAQ
jgi:hypothetical protein